MDATLELPDHLARAARTARTARTRRNGLAAALFLAPWGIVVANTAYALITLHGGGDLDSKGALTLAAAHPRAYALAILAAVIGSLLFVPAVLGAMRMVRVGAARLGLIGGVMMIGGYIAYFALNQQSYMTIAMALHGGASAENVAIREAAQNSGYQAWVNLLFLFGNLVGTFLLGLALRRARTVPAWAAYGVLAWPVLHIVGIFGGSEWFEVAGATALAFGFIGVAHRLLAEPLPAPVLTDAPRTGDGAAPAYELSRR